MGRGKGGSKSYSKRTPSGISTSSKMSKVGEIEAKQGVMGDQNPGNPERITNNAANNNTPNTLSNEDVKVENIAKNSNFTLAQKAFTNNTFPNSTGLVFASPNREDKMPDANTTHLIERAKMRLSDREQQEFHRASQEIDNMFGLQKKAANAIGVWIDGAENSTATKYSNGDPETLKAAAMMKGYLGEQKQVATFTPNPNSKESMYEFNGKFSLGLANKLLKNANFPYHTFIPTSRNSYKVSILEYQPTSKKRRELESIARQLNLAYVDVNEVKGDISFIGDENSRFAGAQIYKTEIKKYLDKHPEYLQKWAAIQQDWQFGKNTARDESQFNNYKTAAAEKEKNNSRANIILNATRQKIIETSDNPQKDLKKLYQKFANNKLLTNNKIPKISEIIKELHK